MLRSALRVIVDVERDGRVVTLELSLFLLRITLADSLLSRSLLRLLALLPDLLSFPLR